MKQQTISKDLNPVPMRFLLLTFLLVVGLFTFGQANYKPTIVVLDPYKTHYDTTLLDRIEEFAYTVAYTQQEEKHILDSLAQDKKNLQLMNIAEFHYRKRMDFGSNFTLSLNGMLTYMVFGQTADCIVIPIHETSDGTIDQLKAIAKRHNVQWVVNPVSLHTYRKDGNLFTTARIQVYNFQTNKNDLDKTYIGDTKNPGFELSCESGSLNCTINNIINPSVHDILLTILGRYQH